MHHIGIARPLAYQDLDGQAILQADAEQVLAGLHQMILDAVAAALWGGDGRTRLAGDEQGDDGDQHYDSTGSHGCSFSCQRVTSKWPG
jgi:hypothetical protein